MHADIEKLMASYSTDATTLIATADCQTMAHKAGTGASLCTKEKTTYIPHIMYGNPANLTEYTGERDFATMKAFVDKHKGGAPGQPHPNRIPQPTCPMQEVRSIGDIIKQLACKYATKKEIEDKDVGMICQKICAKGPLKLLEKMCEKVLDKEWEKVVKSCPKGELEVDEEKELRGLPDKIAELAAKFVCKYITNQDIEDKSVPGLCKKVFDGEKPQRGKEFEPMCEKVMKEQWDQVVQKCPKMEEATIVV